MMLTVLEPTTEAPPTVLCPVDLWTRDGAKALRVARAVETGVMSINSHTSMRVATPFGGFKQSGYGRELGPHALDTRTEVKSVYHATS